MCHIGPGDKCGDGGDGDAGSSRLSKCDRHLWKWGKRLMLSSLTLWFPPRSFRLKAATVSRWAEWSSPASDSSSSWVSCCSIECTEITSQVSCAGRFPAAFSWFTESLSASWQEHQKGLPWWRNRPQSRRDVPKQKRKRRALAESGGGCVLSLATAGYEIMPQSVSERCRCFNNACQKNHSADWNDASWCKYCATVRVEFGFKGFFVFSSIICIHGLVCALKERRSSEFMCLDFTWMQKEGPRTYGRQAQPVTSHQATQAEGPGPSLAEPKPQSRSGCSLLPVFSQVITRASPEQSSLPRPPGCPSQTEGKW